MNRFGTLAATVVSLAISMPSQTQQSDPQLTKVRVEITTDKTDYGPGEFVRFRVMLLNEGESAIYIAKTWSYAQGGVAGFSINVKQLTGKRSGSGCAVAGDSVPHAETRTPGQILREDFVRLGRGELVGIEDVYRGCEVKHPGLYQITAEYSANNFNTQIVSALSEASAAVLRGKVESEPFSFRVLKKQRPAGSPSANK